MIHSNNKSGFSLLETIVAMGIIATMAVPLVIMQGTTLRRVIRDGQHMERIFLMRTFLSEAQQAAPGTTTSEKTVPTPNTQLRYQLMPPQANSSFHALKGIQIERVTATWREAGKETQDIMVSMKYTKPTNTEAAA